MSAVRVLVACCELLPSWLPSRAAPLSQRDNAWGDATWEGRVRPRRPRRRRAKQARQAQSQKNERRTSALEDPPKHMRRLHSRPASPSRGAADSCVPRRTSESHPIRVSWVLGHETATSGVVPPGRLGLCFCPGKKVTRDGVLWDRDLPADLKRLRVDFRATTIVCLLNLSELRHLKVPSYVDEVQRCGLELEHYPIIEMAAPKDMPSAHELICRTADRIRQGGCVIVHCRGGVGRAGLVAACVLLRLGLARTGDEAISEVRRRRGPDTVESRNQEDFVRRYAEHVSRGDGQQGAGADAAVPVGAQASVELRQPRWRQSPGWSQLQRETT